MQWTTPENSDDITALDFHPTQDNLLLAGGDDGLVSIFNISISEQDDSLVQAVQHGPINKVGFVHSGKFFALSSDQNLAIHPLFTEDQDTTTAPVLFGDVRPQIPCEYVVDIVKTGVDYAIAAGSHRSPPCLRILCNILTHAASQSRLDIVNIKDGCSLDLNNKIMLEGAHGEEIVRSIVINDGVGSCLSNRASLRKTNGS
jgi:WD40 repeat protein